MTQTLTTQETYGCPRIIYFKSSSAQINVENINRLQEDLKFPIDICNTWTSLMIQINAASSLSLTTPLIIVDTSMFEQDDATVPEIVNMISTMHRCLTTPSKMKLAVVVKKDCTPGTIKALQETDILGILPCIEMFGYDRTLSALMLLLQCKHHMPKDIIDLINGVVPVKVSISSGIILTDRQEQVLSLVRNRGLSNKKIAQALKISESTVKVHMSAILKQYGVRNRTQLVLAASSALVP